MATDGSPGRPARDLHPRAGRLAALQRATQDWERQRILHGDGRYVDLASRSTASWERPEGGTRQPA